MVRVPDAEEWADEDKGKGKCKDQGKHGKSGRNSTALRAASPAMGQVHDAEEWADEDKGKGKDQGKYGKSGRNSTAVQAAECVHSNVVDANSRIPSSSRRYYSKYETIEETHRYYRGSLTYKAPMGWQ